MKTVYDFTVKDRQSQDVSLAEYQGKVTKFLVDREGQVIARFEPTEDMQDVRAAVAAELEKQA